MAALDVADGDGGMGHGFVRVRGQAYGSKSSSPKATRKFSSDTNKFTTPVFLASRTGCHRCFKLLAAWLLRPGASYNLPFPRENYHQMTLAGMATG